MKKTLKVLLTVFILMLVPVMVFAAQATITAGSNSGARGDINKEIDINSTSLTGLNATALTIKMSYDSSRLTFASVSNSGTLTSGWGTPTCNSATAGQLTLVFFGTTPLTGSGNLVKIYFNVNSTAAAGASALTLTQATLESDTAAITSTSVSGTFTVNVVNNPPVAQDQTVAATEDIAKAITLKATDVDPNTVLQYSIVANPLHGVLSGAGAARTYTPAANYNGPDSFTFKANDGIADSNVATVSITVAAVNDAPVLNPIGPKSVNEAETLSFAISATDVDQDSLTYSASSLPLGATFNPATRTFNWTPAYNQAGSDSVRFTVSDGKGKTDSETITITVADVPGYYALTIKAANGSVTKSPDKFGYSLGDVVTLTAAPNPGYYFYSWSGNLRGSINPSTITMDAHKSVTATFKLLKPDAPSGLSGAALGSGSIQLNWKDNSINESKFYIRRSTSATTGFSNIATVAAGVTTYTNTGRIAGTTYYYQVRAYNSSGYSVDSNTISVTAK